MPRYFVIANKVPKTNGSFKAEDLVSQYGEVDARDKSEAAIFFFRWLYSTKPWLQKNDDEYYIHNIEEVYVPPFDQGMF